MNWSRMRRGFAFLLVVPLVGLVGCSSLRGATGASATATHAQSADPAGARRQLDELAVRPAGSMAGYSREKFPHWSKVDGECDTRETVLKQQGTDVRTDSSCRITAGTWHSPYDGATWTKPSDVDIDHVVPLANAWRSGASAWTNEKREQFANDLKDPQLVAVTDNVNQSKGDQSPDQWKPPLQSYWCKYATDWVQVKHVWQLSVTEQEKAALTDMLARC